MRMFYTNEGAWEAVESDLAEMASFGRNRRASRLAAIGPFAKGSPRPGGMPVRPALSRYLRSRAGGLGLDGVVGDRLATGAADQVDLDRSTAGVPAGECSGVDRPFVTPLG